MKRYVNKSAAWKRFLREMEYWEIELGTLNNIVGKSSFCELSKDLLYMDLLHLKCF